MYNGTTFDPGETFEYTCTEEHVKTSHGSTASVKGTPINHKADVRDSDSTNVTVKDAPAIRITKSAINGSDTQKVKESGAAKYKIVVKNVGVSPLTDVVVTDVIAPGCNLSAKQSKEKYNAASLAPGKSFTYTCEEPNVIAVHTNTAKVTAKSTIGGQTVNDSDDTRVTVDNAPSIVIDKNDADNGDDKQTVKEGEKATFRITVRNDGNAALKDVVITDDAAPGCALGANVTKTKYNGDTFDPGEYFTYTCSATVNSAYVNVATVTAKTVNTGASVDDTDKSVVNLEGKPPVTPQITEQPEPKKEKGKKKCEGSIGNTVWYDANGNGKQDANEKGIPGVHVWLYKGNKVYKDVTNSRGRYKFKELCSGEYRVVVKSEDVSTLYQTYDPDGKLDHRTKVRLRGDKDHHTKADFGYRGAVAPTTGPGAVISTILAALATGLILYIYHRRRRSSVL